jgi:VWFA-related protein
MPKLISHSSNAGRLKLFMLPVICLSFFAASNIFQPILAQSGRQPEKQPQDTRPRRTTPPEEEQDEKAVKLSADLVTAVTSVTDGSGNQINDLSQQDFAVFEDNTLQDIAGFYRESQLPLRLVFLFDASSSIRHRFEFEQRAAARFLRNLMREGDQAAIMSVSTDSKIEVQLTSNIDELTNGFARLKPEGATSLYTGLVESAKYLRPAEGRRVLIVLSDGTDTASAATLSQAMTEVQKSDAVIYAVHSTGVAPSANVQDLAGEVVLKTMSEDTGGRAFFPPIHEDQKKEARDLDEIYKRIAAEVRGQYVLTYYSKSDAQPGVFKNIRVEVRRAGLQVRARRGYYTPK